MPVSQIKQKKYNGISRLQMAYAAFLQELADFEKKERELGGQIKKAVDQGKIHTILQKIVNLKD